MAGKRSLGSTPLWIVVLLGGALTALGVLVQLVGKSPAEQTVAATVAALGASVLGAGISLLVTAGEGRDTLADVRTLLTDSLGSRMLSAESELAVVRRRWFFYHLSQREDRYVWRYTDYRLDNEQTPNTLVGFVGDNVFGRDHVFRAEVAVRSGRMILAEEDLDGRVPGLVALTPDFSVATHRRVRAGVVFLRAFDGKSILSKCLWSAEPLTGEPGQFGDLAEEDGLELDRMWKQTFSDSNVLLPAVTDTIDRDMPASPSGSSPSPPPGRAGRGGRNP